MSKIVEIVRSAVDHLPTGRGGEPSIAEELKALRASMGLSQRKFSERFGLSIANLQTWESPGRNVKPDTSARLIIDMIKADPEGMANLVRKARSNRSKMKPQAAHEREFKDT